MKTITTTMTKEMMEDAIISIEASRLANAVREELLQQLVEDFDRRMLESIQMRVEDSSAR
jgi:hypothetical protein